MSLKINRVQNLTGSQGCFSELSGVVQSGLTDSKKATDDFDAKYGINQGVSRLWKPETDTTSGARMVLAQLVTAVERGAKEAEKSFNRDIERHRENLDKVDKQNRETNHNVDRMREQLDRLGRENQEKN